MISSDYISFDRIYSFFELLNINNIEYILLRNLGNELPNRLQFKKDIDIIVNPKHKSLLNDVMTKNGWHRNRHPWNFGKNFVFLYGMDRFLWYSKNNVNIDVCFQLSCRSLNAGEWFPLDEEIQESVFANKRMIKGKPWVSQLSFEDEFIHLITRSIFDKRKFSTVYIERVEDLDMLVDWQLIENKFEIIFFKFTMPLIVLLKNKEYDKVRDNFLSYKNY